MDSLFLEESMEEINEADRLSNLPDALIYYIFSFFDLNDDETSSNMVSVSRKLRRLIMSSSSITFTVYIHHPSTSISNFHSYLNKVLFSIYDKERHVSLLKSLSLSYHKGRISTLDCEDSIPSGEALRGLETLVLRYYGLDLRDFSSLGGLISCKFPHLKKLVISFKNCAFNDALVVKIGGTSSLVDVEMSCVDCSSVYRKLLMKIDCPSLERLTLKNIKFNHTTCEIKIVAPQLQTLRADRVEFSHPRPNSVPHRFKIHATRLRSFYWKGTPITYWHTSDEPFPSLEEAIVEVGNYCDYISRRDFMKALLRSLQHAKSLTLQQPKVLKYMACMLVDISRVAKNREDSESSL